MARKNRVAKTLATRAGFRSAAEIEDWDATFDRGIAKPKLKELASLGFFANKENLLLFGKTGEGKSHLAVALGRRLCAEGVPTTFVTVNLCKRCAEPMLSAGTPRCSAAPLKPAGS